MLQKLLVPCLLGLGLGAGMVWVGACAADGADGDVGSGGASDGTTSTGRNDASIDVAPDGQQPPGPISYGDLCGDGDCVPGATIPCQPPSGGSTASTGSSMGMGGGGGGGGGGGQGGAGGGVVISYGCQVDVSGNEPASVCAAVNPAVKLNDSCVSSAGCPEGAGCAGETPLCQAYCCDDLDCPTEHFCVPLPAYEGQVQGKKIPVCKKATTCAPFGPDICPEGETCTVVKSDGTTACAPIGAGQACDPCPCAPGHMCNYSTGLCQKLCDSNPQGGNTNMCTGTGGTCQGIFQGIGVCIGGHASCDD